MSSGAQLPYLAPWSTGFTRYSTQQKDLLAGQAVTPPVSGSFLGAYTFAEWPPNAGAVGTGQSAELYGTENTTDVDWFLEYRPDLYTTYPWRYYGAHSLTYATSTASNASGQITTGWQVTDGTDSLTALSYTPTKSGVYEALIAGAIYSTNAQSFSIGVSTSNTTQPSSGNYATGSVAANRAQSASVGGLQFTLTTADTLYVWVFLGASGFMHYYTLGIRPLRIENA